MRARLATVIRRRVALGVSAVVVSVAAGCADDSETNPRGHEGATGGGAGGPVTAGSAGREPRSGGVTGGCADGPDSAGSPGSAGSPDSAGSGHNGGAMGDDSKGVLASRVSDFLDTLGVCTHISQGVDHPNIIEISPP